MMMKSEDSRRKEALKQICHRIVMTHPEAICTAVIELDCGCIHACGVSAAGQPAGPLESHTRTLEYESGQGPICMVCAGSGKSIAERTVHRTLIWPGDESEKPDIDLRNLIGREVFGPRYEETD